MWVTLSNITSKITDGSHNPPPNNLTGIPILSAANIFDGEIQFLSASRWVSEEQWEIENKRTEIQINDILLTIVGTIGRTAIVKSTEKFALQRSVAVLKLIKIYSGYISYVLQSSFLLDLMVANSKGTAQKGIYLNSLKDLVIPIPPLNEQKRIVAKIEELLPYIEQYAEKEEKLTALHQQFPEQLKKSILQTAIQGKLTKQDPNDEPASVLIERIKVEKLRLIAEKKLKKPKVVSEIILRDNLPYEIINGEERCIADEVPFEIPENWCWVRLNLLGEIISGGTPKTNEDDNWNNGSIPWITPADMKYISGKYISKGNRNITENGLRSSSTRLLSKNSIVYSSRAPIGYIAITETELCTNQGFKSIDLYNKELVDYLYYALIFLTSEIQSRASGTTFKEISGSEFGNTIIPIPPLNEQKRIVEKIETLFSTLQNLSKN